MQGTEQDYFAFFNLAGAAGANKDSRLVTFLGSVNVMKPWRSTTQEWFSRDSTHWSRSSSAGVSARVIMAATRVSAAKKLMPFWFAVNAAPVIEFSVRNSENFISKNLVAVLPLL